MKTTSPKSHLLEGYSAVMCARLHLALFFVLMAVGQLFAFEEFPEIITNYGIPVISDFSVVVAISVVLLEIAAIPVLLGMKLLPWASRVSTIAGYASLLYWLIIGLWQSVPSGFMTNAGLFGAKVLLPQNLWLACFMSALLVLYIFVSFYRPKN